MPLHGYTTDRRPPTNEDHILAHPYALAICGWQVLGGVAVLITMFTRGSLSPSLARLSPVLLAIVAVLLVVGGASVIRGLLNDDNDLMVGWRIERTGLVLSIAAWLAYTAAIFGANPGAILTWVLGLFLAGAHAFRLRATRKEEKRIRRRMDETKT